MSVPVFAFLFVAWGTANVSPPLATTPSHGRSHLVEATNVRSEKLGKGEQVPSSDKGSHGAAQKLAALDQKIAKYQKKLQTKPKLWPVWAELGGAYLARARLRASATDLHKAEQALQRSLAIQPNAVALRWLAAVRLDQHRFSEAAKLARKAAKFWPADGISRAVLSDALLAMGEYDEASSVFVDQTQDFYSMAGRSRLLFLTGKPEAAIEKLREALAILELDPSEAARKAKAWAHLMIGGYHFELDRPAKAKEEYSRALALDPERIDMREHLAEWEATYGSKQAAVGMYRNIIAEIPRPKEKIALGALLVDLGFSKEGKQLIKEAIGSWQQRLDQGDISVRRELALALLDHGGDPLQALRIARDDLEVRQDALAYDALAWALFKSGEGDDAKIALSKALKHGTPYRIIRQHAIAIGSP